MGKGYLVIQTSSTNMIYPIADTKISVSGTATDDYYTNQSGKIKILEINTPDKEFSMDKNYKGSVNTNLKVVASKKGYYTVTVNNVKVFPDETSILYINMIPLPEYEEKGDINYETKPYDL